MWLVLIGRKFWYYKFFEKMKGISRKIKKWQKSAVVGLGGPEEPGFRCFIRYMVVKYVLCDIKFQFKRRVFMRLSCQFFGSSSWILEFYVYIEMRHSPRYDSVESRASFCSWLMVVYVE